MTKIYAYKIQKEAFEFYNNKAKEYGFDIIFIEDDLNHLNVDDIPFGVEGVITTPMSTIDDVILTKLHDQGIKYLVTASAGFEHFDLKVATELGFKIGRVPAYSPTSVASWAFTAGLELLKKTNIMFANAVNYDFVVDDRLISKEFNELTIGVIGTGRIGYETAKYFASVGCNVIAYDLYPNEKTSEIAKYVDLETLLATSDLVTLHMNHVKGVNDNFINLATIDKMKDGAVLVNAARAGLVDLQAVQLAIKSNKLSGFANDVLIDEGVIIGTKWDEDRLVQINPDLVDTIKLYPKVLTSQHVAYFTIESVKNIAETTMLNLKQLKETETCDTVIN